ncbi:MAG: cyclase family protein, partial [Thermoanaerobaculia bacterium]|nr:cyclase family protein [Thermoanaerobaculia bacterium]
MRGTRPTAAAVLLAVAATVLGLAAGAGAQEVPEVTAADIEAWMTSLSNWGRWGADDQLGAVNLITPEKRLAAARLVRDGVSVSLAHPVLTQTSADNPNPLVHTMVATGEASNPGSYSIDRYEILYHGFAHTHLDALCHIFWNGKMYNGFDRAEVTAERCGKLGVEAFQQGIFTRGVLVDVAWLEGVDYLEPGTAITPSDLAAWEKRTGVTIGAGDALLVRTGRWARRAEKGPWGANEGSAGLHASVLPWLHQRGVALLVG